MPKPILRENDLVIIFKDNIKLLNELDKSINIDFKKSSEKIILNCDNEQLVEYFNLIKIQLRASNNVQKMIIISTRIFLLI